MKKPIKKISLVTGCVYGIASLGLLASVSACGDDQPWGATTTYPVVATPDPVAVRLSDAADKAANALQSLATVEQARTPSPMPPIAPASSDDLEKTMSVAWSGPASPLLIRLSNRVGYRFEQIGLPPEVPVTVTVNVVEQPILETLRDVGLQMGARANLVIDSNRHVIELEYATTP